jgi:hypothetical protein
VSERAAAAAEPVPLAGVGAAARGGRSFALVRAVAPERLLARGDQGTLDLVVLSVFLVLTAAFGRPFSKLGVASAHVYVTEPAILATIALGLWRCGLRGALERVVRVVPVVPLLILWLFGAIALLRGLHTYGVSLVTHDVGLVEYSIFIPLVAIVVDTREKVETLVEALLVSGVAATVVFGFVFFLDPYGGLGPTVNPGSGIGLFMASLVFLFAARALYGRISGITDVCLAVLAGAALVLMALMVIRSVTLALLLAAGTFVAVAGRGMRLRAAVGAVVVIGVTTGVALLVQDAGLAPDANASSSTEVVASPDFVADDGLTEFSGGHTIRGDAVEGSLSREIRRQHPPTYLELAYLGGLREGRRYTISFWAKAMSATATRGRVGDTSGAGWNGTTWSLKPVRRWQLVQATLVASRPVERLVVYVDAGASRVRVDALRVAPASKAATPAAGGVAGTPAGPPPATVTQPPVSSSAGGQESTDPLAAPSAPTTTTTPTKETGTSGNGSTIVGSVGNSITGGENVDSVNQRWRLAFWRYLLEQTAHHPLFGVGFGKPSAFLWNGTLYDGRTGAARDPQDITGPHNSFVDLVYRTGVGGALALLAIMIVALVRVVRALRSSPTAAERARLVGLTALFAFAVVIASLNVALEGPYMSAFFWTILALLLIAPLYAANGRVGDAPRRRWLVSRPIEK